MNDRNSYFAAVFSRELDRWKKQTNKSQEDFAIAIGLSGKNMITRYKKGVSHPDTDTLRSICDVLGVDESIFYPKTFDDRMKYDKATQEAVKNILREIEIESILHSGIDPLFWEFLWQAVPNIKRLLPSSVHDVKTNFLFQKEIQDDAEFFDKSDLDFVADLQKDVVNYIYIQALKYALGQELKKGQSQAALENRVPEEYELNHHWNSIFCIMLQELLCNPGKETFDGID